MRRIVQKLFLISGTFLFLSTQLVSQPLQQGAGTFQFTNNNKSLQVYYYVPEGDVKTMPILFVMHGTNRNADDYRDNWIELANTYKILVVAPEFTRADYPGSRGYNLGNMFDKEGNKVPENRWAFSLIEPIFDKVIDLTQSDQKSYDMFGHSAGSQFTHRFILFEKNLRINRVVSSNAGWYTIPDFEIAFPYGLKNTMLKNETLANNFRMKHIIQLGEEDNDPNHKYLRKADEAMKQGKHRFERGNYFYQQAKNAAQKLNTPFNWEIRTVPGVGHKNAKMAIDAASYLYGD